MSTNIPPAPGPAEPFGVPPTPQQPAAGAPWPPAGAPDPAAWAQQPGAAPVAGYPQGYAPVAVGPQRNTMLYVVSIILIVSGALTLFGSISIFRLTSLAGILGVSTGMITISGLLSIITGAAAVYAGVIGFQNAANPAKADHLVKIGMMLCGLALLNMIFSFIVSGGAAAFFGVLAFVLPILYIVGANQLKQQAAARV